MKTKTRLFLMSHGIGCTVKPCNIDYYKTVARMSGHNLVRSGKDRYKFD